MRILISLGGGRWNEYEPNEIRSMLDAVLPDTFPREELFKWLAEAVHGGILVVGEQVLLAVDLSGVTER